MISASKFKKSQKKLSRHVKYKIIFFPLGNMWNYVIFFNNNKSCSKMKIFNDDYGRIKMMMLMGANENKE